MDWLKELFRLPADWDGVLTTGATMANFASLACARQWWAERHGVDLDAHGFARPAGSPRALRRLRARQRPQGARHARARPRPRSDLRRDGAGRLDLEALEAALSDLDGAPAIVIGNAGEVNAGDFDPIDALADLAQRHGAWLHVDGAFGLFARATPRGDALTAGIERADSVIADGHKWLNVPYDCGFAFVREPGRLTGDIRHARRLPRRGRPRPSGLLRALPRGLAPRSLARRVGDAAGIWQGGAPGDGGAPPRPGAAARRANRRGRRSRASGGRPAERRLLPPPPGRDARSASSTSTTAAWARRSLDDGRVYMGTTVYDGRVAFRPAIVNWRTTEADVDAIADVVRDLGATGAGHSIQ